MLMGINRIPGQNRDFSHTVEGFADQLLVAAPFTVRDSSVFIKRLQIRVIPEDGFQFLRLTLLSYIHRILSVYYNHIGKAVCHHCSSLAGVDDGSILTVIGYPNTFLIHQNIFCGKILQGTDILPIEGSVYHRGSLCFLKHGLLDRQCGNPLHDGKR